MKYDDNRIVNDELNPYKEEWLSKDAQIKYKERMKSGVYFNHKPKRFIPPKGNNPYEEINRFKEV